jgi:transposase-like protein
MGYSLDFRQRMLACKEENDFTFEKTSEHFDLSLRTLFRWTNNIAPCTHSQKSATKVDMDALKKEIESSPDEYQWERAKRLGVSRPAIYYALKRINISFKKN